MRFGAAAAVVAVSAEVVVAGAVMVVAVVAVAVMVVVAGAVAVMLVVAGAGAVMVVVADIGMAIQALAVTPTTMTITMTIITTAIQVEAGVASGTAGVLQTGAIAIPTTLAACAFTSVAPVNRKISENGQCRKNTNVV